MLLDQIRRAVEEIHAMLVPGTAVEDKTPSNTPALESGWSIELDGRRFWLLFNRGTQPAHAEECDVFLPLPEYPAELKGPESFRLWEVCQHARLAVGRGFGPNTNGTLFLMGVDYVIPGTAIDGSTLRWVLEQLIADADRVERALAE